MRPQWQQLLSLTALTFVRLGGNVQHERQEVLQELCVIIRKLQPFTVFPEETKAYMSCVLSLRSTLSENNEVVTLEPETHVLMIQRSWVAETAYLKAQRQNG